MHKTNNVKPPTKKEKLTLRSMILLGVFSLLNFFYWFLSPGYAGSSLLYVLLLIVLIYSSLRIIYEWYHYWNISVPAPKKLSRDFSVDILTTYFPGEPYEMIENTLKAIQAISYPHTTILCDEADDPHLKDFCASIGVKHISRDNRINAKAGNINNALKNMAKGEICVILDPDHVPQPDFLDHILPYFEDESMGYVQIVQAYDNFDESYVAKGAAQQTYQFYGPMMMCMNSYGTVNAIGANCTFRRAALDSIGGHAPGLAEDMHTAMLLHAKGWKSTYIPKVLARGLVPSSLTAYYKQQLKWSRGTLELLVSVYPKIFNNLTWRQRIHYATIPLHYIVGFIYLINFLIPVIALCTATSPWKGNVLLFGVLSIPLVTSILVVRSFVQRWVMEESERGFHMVGGLLLISTWWVFCTGTIYTFLRKKVPYLPTPKTGDDKTSWKLLIPNVLIALISGFAIVYGLAKDLTPFSIFMSLFALLNIIFMGFSFYLAGHRYKDIENLNNSLSRSFYTNKLLIKQKLWNFRHGIYRGVRRVALPVLLASFFVSGALITIDRYNKWEGVRSYPEFPVLPDKYLGIYAPSKINGLSRIAEARELESELSTKFDLMSHYLPWGNTGQEEDLDFILDQSKDQGYTPFITWEPWASTFDFSSSDPDLANEKRIFYHITRGKFDDYIRGVARKLKKHNKKIFLRFAHEFDNPQYPWSLTGGNTANELKKAWAHVHNIFTEEQAHNVAWVWSPWKPGAVANRYPGDSLVDYVSITALNYGELNPDQQNYSFAHIYDPMRNALSLADIEKPVILAEFGSQNHHDIQQQWLEEALTDVFTIYPEIKGLIFFNSNIDYNLPENSERAEVLDWSIRETRLLRHRLWTLSRDIQYSRMLPAEIAVDTNTTDRIALPLNIKGINYKKGQNWFKNYQVMDIRTVMDDFKRIRGLQFNTVKYYGSRVYDYNMLQAASHNDLSIVYGLWQPESLAINTEDREDFEEEVLESISRLKHEKNILAWNIGNDIISKIRDYNKEENASEKINSHISWLNGLLLKIKAEDPNRPILLDLDINAYAQIHTALIQKYLSHMDALSLRIKNEDFLESYLEIARASKLPYLIGDLEIAHLDEIQDPKRYFFRNWQDQHESNLVSFDGVIDHKGRKKAAYERVKAFVSGKALPETPQKIRILKPVKLLYPGRSYDYHALVYSGENQWKFPRKRVGDQVEWTLVKCDRFGTPLAMKDLGKGPSISLKIPEEYDNFFLIASLNENQTVYSEKTSLNFPDGDQEPGLVAQCDSLSENPGVN